MDPHKYYHDNYRFPRIARFREAVADRFDAIGERPVLAVLVGSGFVGIVIRIVLCVVIIVFIHRWLAPIHLGR